MRVLRGSTVRFTLVVIVALAVRLFALGTNPVEVHPDELAGLVGVSNVLHGRAPLLPFFDLRIQYLPLYGIFETLSTAVLGPSAFAIRLPAVLLGVASVVTLRWLVFEFSESAALADGAAALFAVLPWSIDISRMGWENAAVFPFLLGGVAALTRGLRRRMPGPVLLAGVLLGIGAYSYRAEPFDGALLAAAVIIAHAQRSRVLVRPLVYSGVIGAALVAPLAIGVATHPDFFWRDANIATFGHGFTSVALATFVHNYVAHFTPGPLFGRGDGVLDHGPRYGVLYWWMLPFILGGLLYAPRIVGSANSWVLYAWLAFYPLGGALTNDGVPNFPRTMIGAPLASILSAVGLRATWLWLGRERARRPALWAAVVVLTITATAAFADFARVYFTVYPAQAADKFKYGTASLFAKIRTLAPGEHRVCFTSLDWYNYETLIDYYMAGSSLQAIEGMTFACTLPGSLIVAAAPFQAPPLATLVAIQPDYEGGVLAYVYKV